MAYYSQLGRPYPRGGLRGLAAYRLSGLGSVSPNSLMLAIANAEGFNVAGSVAQKANNPGNLELGDVGYGVTSAAGGQKITNFGSVADGWSALANQVANMQGGSSSIYNPNMSIAQVGALYSGDSSGAWANNVASYLGVSPTATFSTLASSPGSSTDSTDTSSPTDILSIPAPGNTPAYLAMGGAALLLLFVALD